MENIKTLRYPISTGIFKYGDNTAVDHLMMAVIEDFSIVANGENVTDKYTIEHTENGSNIVTKTDGKLIAKLFKDGNNWTLERINYDEIQITVKFDSVINSGSKTFKFGTPYQIVESKTNKTSVIYAGTKFIIAKTQTLAESQVQEGGETEVSNDKDTLFKFITGPDGIIKIKYHKLGETNPSPTPIDIDEDGYHIMNVPDDVNKPTEYQFNTFFNDTKIDSFVLTISPNLFITAEVDKLIKLDDVNKNKYPFENLQISSYDTTKQYYSYTVKNASGKIDGLLPASLEGLEYTCTTFTEFVDGEFKNIHTNIVEVEGNALKVNPISALGTYYVKMTINSGAIIVGQVGFEVKSISQITDQNNSDVDSLDIVANKKYTVDDLETRFNLSQNGSLYKLVDNWVEVETFVSTKTLYKLEDGKYIKLDTDPEEGVKMYENTAKYEAGKTFELVDGKYVKMTTDKGYGYYKAIGELSDILWIAHNNKYLEITYTYKDESGKDITLTQKLNTLTYNGKEYTLLGTSFNMVSDKGVVNFTFDITNNYFKDNNGNPLTTQEFGKNIAYYMKNGASVIYCKQNAYLFENENEILAISIDANGKTAYTFIKNATAEDFVEISKDESQEVTQTEQYYYDKGYNLCWGIPQYGSSWEINGLTSKLLGNLQSLELLYNSFGTNLATDASIIDSINYKADLVFDYGESKYKYVVVSDESYNINVYAHKLEQNNYPILSGVAYSLYEEGNTSLFKKNNNVKSVVFGTGEGGYKIQDKKTITFNANGNKNVISLPITLTYDDVANTTFTYHVDIIVINSTVVNIKYPYNVDNSHQNAYTTFNASISELNNSVDGLYNINDFAGWLGVDTNKVDWTSSTRFAYDLALRSDIINLTNVDNLHNTKRYNVYKYEQIPGSFTAEADKKYYMYQSREFKEVELTTGNTYISENVYFTRTEMSVNDTPISKIEVVATSSTYAIDSDTIRSWFALNGDTIKVKDPADKAQDETLNLTGYVAFKVYAGDTDAYGYYVLKIVADNQFDRVISSGEPRKTATVAYKVSGGETFTTIFTDKLTDKINIVANNISSDLILENFSNVYLFKVDSENAQGEISDDKIKNGQYVPFGTALKSDNQIQTIKLAVVVSNGTSMVHVCNYKIILQPNVEVTPGDAVANVDANLYKYSLKNTLKYNGNNSIDFNGYFTVARKNADDTTTTIALSSVKFDTANSNLGDNWSLDNDETSLKYKYKDDTEIASIAVDEEGFSFILYKNVSEDIELWLILTYGEGDDALEIYLRIILEAFEFKDTNKSKIDNGVEDNTLDLTPIFGNDYTGDWEYEVSGLSGTEVTNVSKDGKTLKFDQVYYQQTTYNVTITLKDVYPNISKTITVEIYPDISAKNNDSFDGYSPTGTRVIADKFEHVYTLTATGSTLNVNVSTTDGTTTITIDSNNQDNALIINAKGTCSVNFTLTDDGGYPLTLGKELKLGEDLKYFVDNSGTATALASEITLSTSGSLQKLNFVHSAIDINARLNITILDNETRYATTYWLYITIPKTYELSPVYRVEGATFETVVAGTDLTLKKAEADASHSIGDHFFGDDEAMYAKADVDKYSNTKTYYTLDNATNKYTKVIAPQAEDIATYYEKVVNESRVAIIVDGKYYYGYNNIDGLGLFMAYNPNRLDFGLETTGYTTNEDNSTINSGRLTFRGVDNVETATLLLSSATITTPVRYEFRIFTAESNYSNIQYNNDLLQIDNPTTDAIDIGYISIPYSQFNDGKNKLSVDLAYLQYDPGSENQVARVVMIDKSTGCETNVLEDNFKLDITATGYISKLVLEDNGLNQSQVYEIDLAIITMNGVSGRITLIISDFEAEYGYNKVSQSYEYVYGGTEIGKLSDKDRDGNTRLVIKVNGIEISQSYVLIQESEWAELSADNIYTLNGSTYTAVSEKPETFTPNMYYKHRGVFELSHKDTINGHITKWSLGDVPPPSNKAQYDSTNGNIFLLNVAGDTAVTLVFDVLYNNELVVGRIFYQLIIQNNLRIGINPALKDNNVIDLYLGSNIYTRGNYEGDDSAVDNATVIDLLQSQGTVGNATVYNNLFVTLEQYSTGNTIAKGKALYNGGELIDGKLSNSELTPSVVANYLRFEIAEDDDVKDKVRVDNETAKLYIKGNPSGSFVLKISAANETGYGISKVININKYDYTQAQYSETVNLNNGNGRPSGSTVPLFKDVGQQDNTNKDIDDYAFASYRLGYALDAKYQTPSTADLKIITSSAKISYKVLTFDYGTSVNEIKNSDDKWDKANVDYINEENVSEGVYSIKLPSVKSTTTAERQYQIVSIRLTISYNEDNEDSENHYYAHYLVYNADQIKVNERYKNSKVITYAETKSDTDTTLVGAWQTGTTLTIMDTNNQGLYLALTPVISETEPTDWGKVTYYKKNTDGSYAKIESSEAYDDKSNYYKLNDIASNPYYYKPVEYADFNDDGTEYWIKNQDGTYSSVMGSEGSELSWSDNTYYTRESKYRMYIVKDGVELTYSSDLTVSDGTVTAQLPTKDDLGGEYLFTNKAKITIIIRATDGGANVIEDEWTVQAGTTIEPKDTKPLRDFFLLSEIGQDLYQNCKIIGLGEDYNSFVTNGTAITEGDEAPKVIMEHNGYTLKEITYKLSEENENSVFEVKAKECVLVGHSTAMSFTFNAGADYFINLTIDDKNINSDTNSAKINLANFVKIWTYNTDSTKHDGKIGFVEDTTILSLGLGVTSDSNKVIDDKISFENNIITISGIDSITQNEFITVTITNGGISRAIQLYFNIVINAKEINNIGTEENPIYAMPYNEMLASAMVGRTELSNNHISTQLKKELLSLIKFNDNNVVNNGVVDNITLNRYSISVKDVETAGYYEITYTYTAPTVTYIRTLKIANPITATLTNGYLDHNAKVKTVMEGKTSLNVESEILKKELLNLITFKGTAVNTEDEATLNAYAINVLKNDGEDYYIINYKYTHTTEKSTTIYYRTFKMALA